MFVWCECTCMPQYVCGGLHLPGTGTTSMHLHPWLFYVGSRSQTRVLMLAQQVGNQLSYLPNATEAFTFRQNLPI